MDEMDIHGVNPIENEHVNPPINENLSPEQETRPVGEQKPEAPSAARPAGTAQIREEPTYYGGPSYAPPASPYPPRPQNYERTWTSPAYPYYGQTPYASPAQPYGYAYRRPEAGQSAPVKAEPDEKTPKTEKKIGVGKAVAVALVFALIFSALFSAIGAIGAYTYMKRNLPAASGSSAGTPSGTVIYESKDVEENPYKGEKNATAISYVVDKVADSVVEITTEAVVNSYYYGRYVSSGAGSGVIISQDGYIVTNNHVVEGTDTITVLLRDGTKYTAKLIGTDEQTDIAVIKIEATGLTAAVMGDSSNLIVGETAIAIGNPLGQLGGTVTDGIISALDREITVEDETMTLIQTNVAVNPGNSGGGLFNIDGELIGIVNAKSSGTDIEGLSFAIPINTAKNTVEQILRYGYVKGRAILGVNIVEVTTASDAWKYRVSEYGVYITAFSNGDFKEWDRIAAIDSNSVSTLSDIKSVLKNYKIGDTVTVTVSRNGRLVDLKVTLIESTPTEQDTATVPKTSDIWDIFGGF